MSLPPECRAHVGEGMCTGSIDATAIHATVTERRAVFARLTARRARKVDQHDVSVHVWTGMSDRHSSSVVRHQNRRSMSAAPGGE